MLLLLVLTTVADAAWVEVGQHEGCTLSRQEPPDASGARTVRAECEWSRDAGRVWHVLSRTAEHDQVFSGIGRTAAVASADGSTTIWQLHELPGLKPREVVLRFTPAEVPGGHRLEWTKADDQSRISGQGVEVDVDSGHWEVIDSGADRVTVRFERTWAPGGRLPPLVGRWFQGAGLKAIVSDLHAATAR